MERITQLIEGNLQAAQVAKQGAEELRATSGNLKALIDGFQLYRA